MLHYHPNKVEQLHTVLRVCLDNPELIAHLGQEEAQYVQKNYNWDQITNQLFEVYRQLIKK